MKKFVTLVLSALVLVSLAACGEKKPPLKDIGLYLITDKGTINDKSFNQGSFEGLQQYAEENNVKANYLRPNDVSTVDYLDSIEEAINAGAKVVVTPGFLFEEAIFLAQEKYPDVKFILVDGVPNDANENFEARVYKVAENTVSILYREEQAGFLAGYAAVKEGFTKLGFMGGMAVPAVVNYGYGYLAGADYAAEELGVKIDVRYTYLGDFLEKPEFKNQASAWYNDEIEVIFASAGGAGNSVMSAAEEANKVMIGVDVDQKSESDTVITSSMKNLKVSVYNAVKQAIEGGFPGGKELLLGVDEEGVSISDDFSRFEKFTQKDYDEIFKKLVDNVDGLADSIPTLAKNGDKASTLTFDNVTIESIGE